MVELLKLCTHKYFDIQGTLQFALNFWPQYTRNQMELFLKIDLVQRASTLHVVILA